MRRVGIADKMLCDAISRAERGLIDADLGGGVIKQRVARPRQGRSGGYRTVIAYRANDRAVFLHGFAKSEKDNISNDELAAMRKLVLGILAADEAGVSGAIETGKWVEVRCDGAAEV